MKILKISVFAATGIIYYMTRSRNCGLQKISGGSWRFSGGGSSPPGNMPGWNTGPRL